MRSGPARLARQAGGEAQGRPGLLIRQSGEKEGARWCRWSSKPVLGAVRPSEGSTPSLLRHFPRRWLGQWRFREVSRLRATGFARRPRHDSCVFPATQIRAWRSKGASRLRAMGFTHRPRHDSRCSARCPLGRGVRRKRLGFVLQVFPPSGFPRSRCYYACRQRDRTDKMPSRSVDHCASAASGLLQRQLGRQKIE